MQKYMRWLCVAFGLKIPFNQQQPLSLTGQGHLWKSINEIHFTRKLRQEADDLGTWRRLTGTKRISHGR